MVVAVSRGPEEAFGYFLPMTAAQDAQDPFKEGGPRRERSSFLRARL